MITPQRALVRPRVIAALTSANLPLEDEVRELLDRRTDGAVAIIGSAVDLREAKYDREQEQHFRKCRAILFDPVCD
jgi:hypothetical protein